MTIGGVLRYKVPQNIDIEDRILGPLTMIQFIYAVIGFGICYVIINQVPAPISYILAVPIGLFVLLIDFIKINERPFTEFFKATVLFLSSPRQRFWHQGDDTDLNIEIYEVKKNNGPVVQHKNVSAQEISSLARTLDSRNGQMVKR